MLRSKIVGICVALLVAVAFSVVLFGDELARFTWQKWRVARVALVLNRGDVALAMEIGRYEFGSTLIGDAPPHFDPAIAKSAYRKALAIQPGVVWAHYGLARIAFAEGDLDGALEEINAELAANPDNVRALYIRGIIYGYRGAWRDLSLAEADFKRFTQSMPSEWAGYNDLAWILAKEEKYAEIENVIAKAFKEVPHGRENPWLWNMLGTARLNMGDKSGARSAFGTALALARELNVSDWHRAYSGNDPARAKEGLDAFIAGIEANILKAGG